MPLGKYYCDYCEKQFQDTPSARKRHLHGAAHLRARALWFDSFKHSSRPPHAFPQTPGAQRTPYHPTLLDQKKRSTTAAPTAINLLLAALLDLVAGTTHGISASLPLLHRHPDGSFAAAAAAKGLCHHFVRTGICRYGDSCKYYHPATAASGLGVAEGMQAPNFFGNPPIGGSSFSGNMARDKMALWGHLPPSLQPPPEGGYPLLPFVDWG